MQQQRRERWLIGVAWVVGPILTTLGIGWAYRELTRVTPRPEVPSNVDGIKTSQLAYQAAFDTYKPCASAEIAKSFLLDGASPRARRDWDDYRALSGDCWDHMGWAPDGDVRSAYWVEVDESGDDFTVWGITDPDGDGEWTAFTATRATNAAPATFITGPITL